MAFCLVVCGRYVLLLFMVAIPVLVPYLIFDILMPTQEVEDDDEDDDNHRYSAATTECKPALAVICFHPRAGSSDKGAVLLAAQMGAR